MKIVMLDKKKYSESVIRQSLYWVSSESAWNLKESNDFFEVTLKNSNEGLIFTFERLLNDYLLREKAERQTKLIRESIINKVLMSIDARLSK
ncbi:TPA: His-Xaa-Ser system protein HxsD [Morganella morganii]|nr:His-Xaa-Ser system protein HxsD [Morganella morganii]MBT0317780.1 His-Xaa-Ser system protein HxsD [Morganella morganii subsp. morganii]EKW3939922.1 His-Xaa-Ser system protein HxsD [Morganella morganii]MBT0370276.1 His-Xaa-Ser system protein HxsD [Morganella morganii subsp. morganii]MBT0442444.1 His-Xaa-Ser system protein HxsD [Morganella morganii subsp. morganii]